MKFYADARAFSALPPLLEELAAFGMGADGGVTRLLYSADWKNAQLFLAQKMKEAGLEVRFDRVGNLYGRLPGRDPDAPVVLTGSHIDTVRAGGKYDGAYGVAAGFMALSYLKGTCGLPDKTLEVVSFCEEEGSRFPISFWGSGSVAGMYTPAAGEGIFDAEGESLMTAMQLAGFGQRVQPVCSRSDIEAFVEVHIEQGIVLERSNKRIGVVNAIAGQRRYSVLLKGRTDHAGTTPMPMRLDALAGASEMMVWLEGQAIKAGDSMVATVGRLEAKPNASNVIPGEVTFSLDIRHDSELKLSSFCSETLNVFETIARSRGLQLEIRSWLETKPVPMNGVLTEKLERICENMELPYRRMISGAGHDAQVMASICPAAMIFVPSSNGVSHSPQEHTAAEHLAQGAAVLAACLYDLAY